MRHARTWLASLALLTLLFSATTGAATVSRLNLEQAVGDGSDVALYLDARNDSDDPVSAADLPRVDVFIDGKPVAIQRKTDFAASGEGIGYIFLVDVSKSLRETTYARVRAALKEWIDAMRPADRAALISFGSEVQRRTGFTDDRAALHALVADLGPTDQNTRLYQGLEQALDLAASHRQGPPRRKLIVTLSDGDDDLPAGAVGISLDEIKDKVDDSGIPIHAIAFRAPQSGLRVLDTLARRSGGTLLQADNAGRIANSYADLRFGIDKAILIEGRCPDCPQDGRLYPIQVRLDSGLSVTGQPQIRLSAASRVVSPPSGGPDAPGTEPEPPAETPPPVAPVVPAPSTSWIADWRLWAGIGLIIALAAGLIAWRSSRRPREPAPDAPISGLDFDAVPMPPTAAEPPSMPEPVAPPPTPAAPRPDDIPTAGRLPDGARQLKLTLVSGGGPQGEVYALQISRPVVIGRGQNCTLSIPGDDEVSRHHAQIELRQGRLVILDLDSTHGTFVNGVPVQNERLLEPGDVLRLGRTELRLGD